MKSKVVWAATAVLAAGSLAACSSLNGLLAGGGTSGLTSSTNLTSNNSNSLSSVSPLTMTLSNGSTYATQALTAGAPASPTINHIFVNFSQVQIHYDGSNTATESLTAPATDSPDTDPGWMTFNASTSQQIDLENLATDTAFGTMDTLKNGTYTQIRLAVQSAEVDYTLNGTSATASLDVPSNELKVIKPFVLKPGYSTTLHFDFNTANSVRQANGSWMINPTAIHTVPTYTVLPSASPSPTPSASPSASPTV